MRRLTKTQEETIVFMSNHLNENNYYPSISEVAEFFNINKNAARSRLLSCMNKEYVYQKKPYDPYRLTEIGVERVNKIRAIRRNEFLAKKAMEDMERRVEEAQKRDSRR